MRYLLISISFTFVSASIAVWYLAQFPTTLSCTTATQALSLARDAQLDRRLREVEAVCKSIK